MEEIVDASNNIFRQNLCEGNVQRNVECPTTAPLKLTNNLDEHFCSLAYGFKTPNVTCIVEGGSVKEKLE